MSAHISEGARAAAEYTFTANVYKEDDDYVAECAELGTVSQGRTIQETVDKLKEATSLYLQAVSEPMIIPVEQRADLIEGVRELEAAYARELDEPVEPVDIRLVETTTFTIEPAYA
jgi:predicted RNase H-like HicB family nuclease